MCIRCLHKRNTDQRSISYGHKFESQLYILCNRYIAASHSKATLTNVAYFTTQNVRTVLDGSSVPSTSELSMAVMEILLMIRN